MPNVDSVVATYDTHEQADLAVKELQQAGVDMKSLSIAAKDSYTDEHVVGYYNVGDRMKYWGKLGAFWGGFWGLLFGSAMFAIPGIGPILVAGPLVAWIVAGSEDRQVPAGRSWHIRCGGHGEKHPPGNQPQLRHRAQRARVRPIAARHT
jgi:hypothetical protein